MTSLGKDQKNIDSSRAFITGISGFVGGHLARSLRLQGWQVFGFDRHGKKERKNLYVGDLTNRDNLTKALKECQPDAIFHLAGLIKSTQPEALYRANLLGTIKLFESVLELRYHPVVIIASSSAIYGSGWDVDRSLNGLSRARQHIIQ